MNTTKLTYNVADAMAAMILAPDGAPDEKLRDILSMASDIPPDRLDFALSELKQALPQLRMMVHINAALSGTSVTTDTLKELLTDAEWTDDTKGDFTFAIHNVDEDGNELASAVIKQRIHR